MVCPLIPSGKPHRYTLNTPNGYHLLWGLRLLALSLSLCFALLSFLSLGLWAGEYSPPPQRLCAPNCCGLPHVATERKAPLLLAKLSLFLSPTFRAPHSATTSDLCRKITKLTWASCKASTTRRKVLPSVSRYLSQLLSQFTCRRPVTLAHCHLRVHARNTSRRNSLCMRLHAI